MKSFFITLLALFSLAACTWFERAEIETESIGAIGDIITISGTVTDTIDDCAFDGICAYLVTTDRDVEITVIWSEGDSPNCANDMFRNLSDDENIQIGDSIEAQGHITGNDSISVCGDASYFINKLG